MLCLEEVPSVPQPWALRGSSKGLAPLPGPFSPQGPFVHLSVMIAAYLGRVRTKTIGESEVRGSGRAPLGGNEREGADLSAGLGSPRTRANKTKCWWRQQRWAWPQSSQRPSVVRPWPSPLPWHPGAPHSTPPLPPPCPLEGPGGGMRTNFGLGSYSSLARSGGGE